MGKHPIKLLLKNRLPHASCQTMLNFYYALTRSTLSVESLDRNRKTGPWRMLIRKTFGKHLTEYEVRVKSMGWHTHFKRKVAFRDIVRQIVLSRSPPVAPNCSDFSASVKKRSSNLVASVHACSSSDSASSLKTYAPVNACSSSVDALDLDAFLVRNVEIGFEQPWYPCVPIKFQPPTIAFKTHFASIFRVELENSLPPLTSEKLYRPRVCKDTIGDGNCFYRSISYILFSTEKHFGLIRNAIFAFLNTNKHILPLPEVECLEVLEGIRGTAWGDCNAIMGLSALLQTTVHIYYSAMEEWFHFYPFEQTFFDPHSDIYLLCEEETHYCVVLDVCQNDLSTEIRFE